MQKWWRKRPFFRAQVLLHRWPALILGLFLVLETTSGAILLYDREIFRATNGGLYSHSASGNPVDNQQAIEVVRRQNPEFPASWVHEQDNTFIVGDNTYTEVFFVDPESGRINGHTNRNEGFMAWLTNLHDGGFTLEGYPWYSPWLAHPVWEGGPSFLTDITWGALILGVLGVLMIVLVLTSLRIWWPGMKRIATRFTVRRGRGRFARDYDLHNVIGAVALPFILMWGITGAAYEFPGVEKAWVWATGGDTEEVPFDLATAEVPSGTPKLTFGQVSDIASSKVPGKVVGVYEPAEGVAFWEVDIQTDYHSSAYRHIYNGDAYVLVDPHVASNVKVIGSGQGEPVGNRFYDKFFEPTHEGWNVNGWWRIVWFVLGMTPLILMITGISTWLYRRGVKKRRKQAGQVKLTDAQLDPDKLDRDGSLDVAQLDPGDESEQTVDEVPAKA